ncbi:ribosome biogenesis GTPase Der [Limnoglobus roseus]|uniref:GTPase Der n=1 Tax=Limnoglobus roseus TaxID=2598579 RepID=A0A5C1AM54_9BACT|nr:ribosome biogenesis GTPase Der [Limnoglobus roseus]QEL20301.1 ribosome biogenesis GTPase Der [Limnoglobus roseus]
MAFPIVVIVGRPNVGKSSLFNMLAGRRISIVDPTAGVTRDRISTILEAEGRHFELIDTGGMGILDVDNLTEDVERQIRVAIEMAAVVLFVVDIREGAAPLDQVVAERLRVIGKPVIFVANKADEMTHDTAVSDLFRLGYGEPVMVSANSKRGKDELVFKILDALPAGVVEAAPVDPSLKIAIVGRRNVGKSTFINSIAQEERVIVSEVPGTTRDSIDVRFERDGKTYLAIDTAGVRKKGKFDNDVEFYSLHRAERSIRRADVVLHFFDARSRVSRVDKQLAEYIAENNKPAIVVVNKWDLVRHAMETEKMADYIHKVFPMLDHVPIAFVTAKTGKNTFRVFNLAQELHKQAGERIPTGELNRILRAATDANAPPVRHHNKQGKIFYAAQVGTNPPTIALVTNGPDTFDQTYLRYLTKVLRDQGPFGEVSIKFLLRAKGETTGDSKFHAEVEDELPAEPQAIEPEPAPEPKPRKKKKGPQVWDV